MKLVLLITSLLGPATTHALSELSGELTCEATNIFDLSVLEESFSLNEYPFVVVSADKISLGMSSFSKSDGDKIDFLSTPAGSPAYQITTPHGEQFLVTYKLSATGPAGGDIYYRADRRDFYAEYATLDCSDN